MTQERDEIDPHDNRESRVTEESASQGISRSSAGGPIFSGGRPADLPEGEVGPEEGDPTTGTSGGDPLDGVRIDPDDAEQAVPGDLGPEHPGQR